MGQGSLVAYWTGGAFVSQAYLDEYWCVIFLLDAARRLVARELVSPAGAFARVSSVPLRAAEARITTATGAKADLGAPGYINSHS